MSQISASEALPRAEEKAEDADPPPPAVGSRPSPETLEVVRRLGRESLAALEQGGGRRRGLLGRLLPWREGRRARAMRENLMECSRQMAAGEVFSFSMEDLEARRAEREASRRSLGAGSPRACKKGGRGPMGLLHAAGETFEVLILKKCDDQLLEADRETYKRARGCINRLTRDPSRVPKEPERYKRLEGASGRFWRVKAGRKFRLIFLLDLERRAVVFCMFGPRKDVYEKFRRSRTPPGDLSLDTEEIIRAARKSPALSAGG